MIHRLYPPPDVNGVLATGLVTQFGGVPVLGDLIEVFTGVEDGDLNDIATWVNTLLDAAAGLGIVLDVIGDILGFITGFIPGSGDEKSKLAGVINSKAAITAVPIDSPLWRSMERNEESTFPRSQLNFGAASGTNSGGSGDTSHSHGLGQVPDYQPAGNNNDFIEIGFIRISVDATTSKIGFITGNSNTFAGITAAYVGFFRQESNGNLTLLNTSSATTNIKSSITQQNTEFVFNLGLTVTMLQGEVYAIGVLQDTSIIQTAASLMRTTQTNLNRASGGTTYPRKGYAYAGNYSAVPSSIAESALQYDASTKIPFYFIQRNT